MSPDDVPAPTSVVNVLKAEAVKDASQTSEWNSQSAFDTEKDKNTFRQYETACDRVKAFYKEQHGTLSFHIVSSIGHQIHARSFFPARVIREANSGI